MLLDKSLKGSLIIYKFTMVDMNHWQKEKQKTITMSKTTLSFVVLTSAVIVLSSIAAAQQLLVTNSNTAFAEPNHEPCTSTEIDGILEETCSGGSAFGEESEAIGGSGGHGTCTLDKSTDIADCTFSGGTGFTLGPGSEAGGSGGRSTYTEDLSTGDRTYSFDAGGGGIKPVPDEGG
jgi:hypothetical protein